MKIGFEDRPPFESFGWDSLELQELFEYDSAFPFSLQKKANHKPGSVRIVTRDATAYHLSSTDVTASVDRPTLRNRASNP